jgi:hypothetical protein
VIIRKYAGIAAKYFFADYCDSRFYFEDPPPYSNTSVNFLFFVADKKTCPEKRQEDKKKPVSLITAVLARYNIGRTPATLVSTLIRWELLTLWHLWMFLGSSISL